ncbi:ATP-binding domain-containing protein [Streptomyces graminofaciens]|uniref:ATP-binding domain-containing protein n=1 Tax=Streptomyces graminofaciens TaxID=68212 RepID=UPI0033061339
MTRSWSYSTSPSPAPNRPRRPDCHPSPRTAVAATALTELILGLTCHQAKGKEWSTVGVRLEENDTAALHNGLVPEDEEHRSLYVALTRARRHTIALVRASGWLVRRAEGRSGRSGSE